MHNCFFLIPVFPGIQLFPGADVADSEAVDPEAEARKQAQMKLEQVCEGCECAVLSVGLSLYIVLVALQFA